MVPERKNPRKWKRLVFAVGLILILPGAIYFYRIVIAQYFLEQVAEKAGVPDFSAEITELSHQKIQVQNLSAGKERELSFKRLDLNFDLIELLEGGELAIHLDGLQLKVDATGSQPVFGSLETLFSGGPPANDKISGNNDVSGIELLTLPLRPEFHLSNSFLEVRTEPGLAVLPISAVLVGTSEDDLQGWLTFDGGKLAASEPEEFYVGMIFSQSDLQIDWDIDWQDAGFKGQGAASFFLDDPGLTWNVFGEIAGELPGAIFQGTGIEDIHGVINLDGVGSIPFPGGVPDKWRTAIMPIILSYPDALASLEIKARTEVLLSSGMKVQSDFPLKLKQNGRDTEIQLQGKGIFTVAGLSKDPTIPSALLDLLGDKVTGELLSEESVVSFSLKGDRPYLLKARGSLKGETAFDLLFYGDASGWINRKNSPLDGLVAKLQVLARNVSRAQFQAPEISLETSIAHEGNGEWKGNWKSSARDVLFTKVGAAGSLKISRAKVEGEYALTRQFFKLENINGDIDLSHFKLPEILRITRPAELKLKDGKVSIGLPSSKGEVVNLQQISLKAFSKDLRLHISGSNQGATLTDLQVDLLSGEQQNLKLDTTVSEIFLPDLKLRIERFSHYVAVPVNLEKLSGDIGNIPVKTKSSGVLISEESELSLPPFLVTAKSEGDLRKVNFQTEMALVNGPVLLKANGTMNLETLDGDIDVVLPKILLLEGAVQPATFSPLLSDIEITNGSISGRAEIEIDKGLPDGHGYINLDIAGAVISGLPVKDLEARFFFQSLDTPRLPPGQSLKIGEIDVGIPIKNIDLLFGASLINDDVQVDLRKAKLDIAAGQISLRSGVFQILEAEQILELQVSGLDIKELFALIGRDDFSGTGFLSGQIPVKIIGDEIVIEKGHLETRGPGVLHIRSQVIAEALAAGGAQVELLVEALKNFDYTELTLDIEKPLNAAAQVKLGISGSNKAVLDGYPFRLNINLETRVEPLLDVLLRGQQISQDLISGFLKKH